MNKNFFKIFSTSILIFAVSGLSTYASTFPDVDAKQMYSTAIEFLSSNGIVKGYPDGNYGPDIILNRAELLKIIAEGSAKISNQGTGIFDSYANAKCFSDVKSGQWYTKYICYAKANNWVVGYQNGKYFKPDQKVSFVEALKMTFKAFNLSFSETSTPWYHDLVDQASRANYIPFSMNGFAVGLRRDQMADLVTRILKASEGAQALQSYLGDRAEIVASYETLEQGLDLSTLKVETKTP
ncbi:MAG: S-layer homology domain-containing protein [Candidatus Peregrinibacteria bacterium]|nr:S-layer homology domain-containing protein [Candidatus Peregrinibacteria bacterium]